MLGFTAFIGVYAGMLSLMRLGIPTFNWTVQPNLRYFEKIKIA